MSQFRSLLVLTIALATTAASAAPATAEDSQPCGAAVMMSWSAEAVQPCPLAAPLAPNGWVPVYREPVAVAPGETPPEPDGWLHGTAGQHFVCDAKVPDASFTHPRGWRNDWWAYTQADGSDLWGWVPEVFFAGGADDEADAGLRRCPSAPKGGGAPAEPGADQSCAPEPAVTGSGALGAEIRAPGGRAARTIRVGYGRKAEIGGVLRDAAGKPIADAAICVVARPDGQDDAPFLELGRTTTDANGGYRVAVAPGPSRELVVIYRTGEGAVVTRAVIKVVPRMTARLSRTSVRNMQTVRISGRLHGGPFPKRGVLVGLQAIRGGRWAGFSNPIRTDSQGRFRFTYRFEYTGVTQTYRLRTRVPAQSSYPYVTGASRAMRIRVRGE